MIDMQISIDNFIRENINNGSKGNQRQIFSKIWLPSFTQRFGGSQKTSKKHCCEFGQKVVKTPWRSRASPKLRPDLDSKWVKTPLTTFCLTIFSDWFTKYESRWIELNNESESSWIHLLCLESWVWIVLGLLESCNDESELSLNPIYMNPKWIWIHY